MMRSPLSVSAPEHYQDVLSTTATLLLQDSDPDTLCQAVYEHLRQPFGVDVYFHYLVSDDHSHLRLASTCGTEEIPESLNTLEFGTTVCGIVAKKGVGIYVSDVHERRDEMTSFIRQMGVRAYDCHPLIIRGNVIGTLSFGSTFRTGFRDDEREVFRLIAQQITLASDRRIQNEQMRQMERLAAAGRMSATLAHEIHNPLESLRTILYLLRKEIATQEGHVELDMAESQVRSLAEISRRTLSLFRGQQQPPKTTDISDIAQCLLNEVRLPHHIRLATEIEPNLCVRAVAGELRQVLFNLMINAAQFSPPGKEVLLSVCRTGTRVEVRVRDQGPGITPETRANIFQPFFTTRDSSGTGVGLWTSRETIERMGGTLTFISDPATTPGAEFIIRLPLVN